MKKLILAVTVLGLVSFTSCRENEKKVVRATEKTMKDIHYQIESGQNVDDNLATASKTATEIPQFSTGELQEFAQSYAKYFEEIAIAQSEKDEEKLEKLLAEGLDWSKKVANWTQKMTEEDAQKWIRWSSRLRSSISNS